MSKNTKNTFNNKGTISVDDYVKSTTSYSQVAHTLLETLEATNIILLWAEENMRIHNVNTITSLKSEKELGDEEGIKYLEKEAEISTKNYNDIHAFNDRMGKFIALHKMILGGANK